MANETPPPTLRRPTAADFDRIAEIWHSGWIDGHAGNVPDGLLRHRGPADFRRRVPARVDDTTVAVVEGAVVGFVMVHDDEIEQVYVHRAARGGVVAPTLMDHGEREIAKRYDVAWLSVVAGNARARRFYERTGWTDAGAIAYDAFTADGPMTIPTHRYEKPVG